MLASYAGHRDVMCLLLHAGAQPNRKDKKGRTPLHEASVRGHFDACAVLLEAGASVTTQNKEDRTPLHTSCGGGFQRVALLLLASYLDRLRSLESNDIGIPGNKRTRWARFRGGGFKRSRGVLPIEDDSVTGPVALSAPALDADDTSPIAGAAGGACEADFSADRSLLTAGDSMESRGSANSHSTWLPVEHSQILEARDSFHHAYSAWTTGELAGYCRKNATPEYGRAISNMRDKTQWTIVNDAACAGMLEVLKVAVAAGVDVNARRSDGHRPVHDCCIHGHADCLSFLLAVV